MSSKTEVTAVEGSAKPAKQGRYRVLAELGQGGMANVYLAVACGSSGVNKLVVLKTMRLALASDPEFLEMFLNEARLAARLNHPHVVQTYEVDEHNGCHMIVMEYLDGEALSAIQTRSRKDGPPFPLAMQMRILADVLSGLHHAHELTDYDGTEISLVHRDVSPQNIFVTFDGQVKVLDFGIAKAAVGVPVETRSGVLKGKVRYMAPEQMAGERVDRRADIYAVGVMLWEAATRQKLWANHADVVVMHKVMGGATPSPREVVADVPESIDRICKKAMALLRDDRYATAREFEKDLDEALATLGDVKPRAIGDFVSELFADVRRERKVLIESQLSKASTLTAGEYDAMTPVRIPVLPSGNTNTELAELEIEPEPQAAPRRTGVVVAALFLGVGVTTGVFLLTRGCETKSALTATQASAPYPSQAAPLGSELSPAGSPSAATTAIAPVAIASGEKSEPRFMASATTAKQGRPPPRQSAAATGTAAAKATATQEPPTAPASAKPNCAHPYFVDERGIKRIRPECI